MEFSVPIILLLIGKCWSEHGLISKHNAQRSQWEDHQLHSRSQSPSNALYVPRQATSHTSPQIWRSENPILQLLFGLLTRKSGMSEGRRLPFMLPVMYNLGVITTLLVVLTVLMVKGLTLGLVILTLTLQGKGNNHDSTPPHRPVHIHVHGNTKSPYSFLPDPWDRIEEELDNNTNLEQLYHPRSFRR